MDYLFFIASKLFWGVLNPDNWIVALLIVSLAAFTRRRIDWGLRLLKSCLLLVLTLGILPIGELLMRPLETRFASNPFVDQPAGIIVLGGGEDAKMMTWTGLPEVNGAADRFLAGISLARKFPNAKLVFSGGDASLVGSKVSGATVARRLFEDSGIAPDRLIFEGFARNTAENALFTRTLVGLSQPKRPWLLVTSAFHMPRAVGSFCAAGWHQVIPYPVDYRTPGHIGFGWALSERLQIFGTALKEWIGLVAYRVTGRTKALLPAEC